MDDQPIIRGALKMLVDSSDEFEVVAEASDGAEALTQVTTHRPDVVLMDLNMPRIGGIEATRRLTQLPESPYVLILSVYSSEDQVLSALRAGACGFLLKDLRPEELFAALHTVAAGGRVIAPSVLTGLVRRAADNTPIRVNGTHEKLSALSQGEHRVLALVGVGKTNAQIAKELHLSGASVKTYVSRTLAKLGLGNRTQAAILAHESGITTTGPDGEPRRNRLPARSISSTSRDR
ncbi:response regulator transcription factor [Streptomyces sp. H27-D2]|uniref:response regulator transcription factor n=1 Tax=Streptomyces sp. H27-D2 TaxID=3046304 RepID=UPI002DBD00B1|nr:response regulator transcription factor [Streptomyces sp. H27-D2]MEC4017967.1 response regulator transcription factor [Streptomyces sp. H27-D2]